MTSSVMDAMSGFLETWSISGSRCRCSVAAIDDIGASSDDSAAFGMLPLLPSPLLWCVRRYVAQSVS